MRLMELVSQAVSDVSTAWTGFTTHLVHRFQFLTKTIAAQCEAVDAFLRFARLVSVLHPDVVLRGNVGAADVAGVNVGSDR
ncbi:hypothetical protein DIJ64_04495 [Mycobacterium leprae]|uniref:Uncharacterized protein n=1 Tax=Mycobacterium leprae TaxID=1769 RepID=A0AAD0P4N5_MYCLR|nr:hypothetical protein [Mycobacterium leprae]AWV47600.1 hypothetical protein DIJ64_04495 [Mycobacterium leprae]